ncbi:substrate-binding domain-containing protein [Xanthomonas citri]
MILCRQAWDLRQITIASACSPAHNSRPPTAIFCSNDDMAAAAVAVAHGLGLRVSEDVSVAGFDDTPVATTIWPELTTVHQPVAAMGRAEVSLLADAIRQRRKGESMTGVHQVMKYTVVKRGSTAAPPQG